LRQANLARVRGDKAESDRLLQAAQVAAPRSAAVLEEIGDRYFAERKLRQAKESYQAALDVEPGRPSAERKLGEAVLALQMVLDPSKILGEVPDDDSYVGAKALPVLSFLVPGLGQLANGETGKGLTMMAVWAGSLLMTGLLSDGFRAFSSLFGRGGGLNPVAFLPLSSAVVAFAWAVGDASSTAKLKERRNIVPPKPPVDMEF
jgi:tetratricopeptide (TPR) repeat protein